MKRRGRAFYFRHERPAASRSGCGRGPRGGWQLVLKSHSLKRHAVDLKRHQDLKSHMDVKSHMGVEGHAWEVKSHVRGHRLLLCRSRSRSGRKEGRGGRGGSWSCWTGPGVRTRASDSIRGHHGPEQTARTGMQPLWHRAAGMTRSVRGQGKALNKRLPHHIPRLKVHPALSSLPPALKSPMRKQKVALFPPPFPSAGRA
eukprot:1995624-Rhodomonas_salina.1